MKKFRSTKQTRDPVRKLSKTGKYSYSITIPKDIIKKIGWKERQKLIVKHRGSKITIEDWKK